mgnify:CR=1 FL=1
MPTYLYLHFIQEYTNKVHERAGCREGMYMYVVPSHAR